MQNISIVLRDFIRRMHLLLYLAGIGIGYFYIAVSIRDHGGWVASHADSVMPSVLMGWVGIGAYIAIAAALEMRVIREIWPDIVLHRASPTILWHHAWVPTFLGILSMFIAAITVMGKNGFVTLPNWRFILLMVVTGLGWAVCGMAVGLIFHPLFATVILAIVPFIVVAVPPSLHVMWVRLVNAAPVAITEGVGGARQLAWAVVLAGILMVGAVVAASISVFIARLGRSPVRWLAITVSGLCAVGVATISVTTVNDRTEGQATDPTPLSALKCVNDVCLWPDSKSSTFQTNTLARDQVFELWKQHGLPEPSTRTIYDGTIASIAAEGHYAAPRDGLPIAQDTDQADGVRTYMVKQLLQVTSGCPLYTGEELYAAEEAVSPAVYQQLMTADELIEAIAATLTGNGVEQIYSDLPDDQLPYGRPLVVPTDQIAASFQQVRNTCAHIRSQR